ncbi:putative uncharacterized protein DDB_G0291608 isoform X2 [Vespa crabro]|uniref:putative uncharacterized protein DDB_G0291608 isoform X2 n=1 Tax=Vespa crabro TaxID=7445 RepID=UPI001F02E44A|nr:putative uncharacterized protein DDB_G0291608 isoform X2 [Vespa crabro]
MVSSCKMTPWLMAIFCLATAGCTNVTDQQTSETTHNHQVAILKQIRKVNEDGSYTYGYEAGDGSFKEHISVVQSIPRVNRTSSSSSTSSSSTSSSSTSSSTINSSSTTTTKRPNLMYGSTEATTKSSVVQSIPRTRKTATTSTTSTTTQTTSTESAKNIFNHYLKGNNKSRPRFVINGQQRPIGVEEDPEDVEDSQINRPSVEEKNNGYRRILFAKRPIEQNLRPITEDFVEKDDDPKISTGNNLRRQLHDDVTKASISSMDNNNNSNNNNNNNNNDEHSDVYSGALSTTRPLFTTTTPSRVIQRIPGTRLDRPKIYVNRENLGPVRFDDPKYESPRVYEPEAKSTLEEQTSTQPILLRGPPRIPVDNRDYLRQTTEPIFVRGQSESYVQELQPRVLLPGQQNNIEEEPAYRHIPIGRILYRPVTTQQQLYSTTTDPNVHYLADNPTVETDDESRMPINQNYVRPRPYSRPLIYQELEARARPIVRPIPQSSTPAHHHIEDREYQQTTPDYVYRTTPIALPPEPPNPIAPPLSRRDFQMLLRRLLVSQYGVQALTYPKTYLEDALYDQQPYPSYHTGYQTPIPRPDLSSYDQQVNMQYGDRVALRRPPVYTRGLNPLYQAPHQYDDYQDGRFTPKRVYRQKFYTQEINDDGDEILPAPIREALLLRMLQLAINAERPAVLPNTMISSTTTPTSRYRKTGPVRSVQIITDESDEDKDIMNKKM